MTRDAFWEGLCDVGDTRFPRRKRQTTRYQGGENMGVMAVVVFVGQVTQAKGGARQ